MGAIAQIHPNHSNQVDPRILFAAIDAFPEALAIVDDGRIIYGNLALARMFGEVAISKIIGRTLGELHAQIDDDSQHLQTSAAKFSACDRDLLVLSARFLDARESSGGELSPSQRLETVGRLVGGVAHDFNNLLTGILLSCDLLLLKMEKASPLRRYAQEMRMAGAHGTALIQQLLTIARPGKVDIHLLSWNEVISDVKDLLTRLIGENIELTTDLVDNLNLVKMDAAQARQILLNLVLNARDAMSDGGQISLKTRNCVPGARRGPAKKNAMRGWIEFEIEDTGCGMDKETRARVFDSFFTTKANGKGNGLGLATVKSIVKQYQGRIALESAPGKGTRVRIRLPGVRPEETKGYQLLRGKIV